MLMVVLCALFTQRVLQYVKVSLTDNRVLTGLAHPDLEVFRLRLGKSLDFDFFEDWQGSLFSRAEPRTGGPSLDIERAMTKLEKVALRYTRKNRRPLVMGFTSGCSHLNGADDRHSPVPQHGGGSGCALPAATTSRGLGSGWYHDDGVYHG